MASKVKAERVTAVYYDGTNLRVDRLESLESVIEYLKTHSGAQIWVDVRTNEIGATLKHLGVEDPGQGPVIHEVREPSQTLLAYTHTVRGSWELHRTVMAAIEHDVLVTVHDSRGETDSKQAMLEYIYTLVDKELSDVPKAILYFRDMLVATILDSQADEFIVTLQEIVRHLSQLQHRLESGESGCDEVEKELFRVHMFVEDEFPASLLAFRDVVAKLRMGAGKNIDLKQRHDELEDILKDVDGALAIKANVEKTIDLVNSSIRNKLTERSIESQRRLQQAVWVLTRLSVLLIIPMLVLNFWRLTPWIGDATVSIGGAEVPAFWFSLVVAFGLTLLALLVLTTYLKNLLGGTVREALEDRPKV
ncbi:MAG: hypothetical protein JSW25_08995 [Thermoplasmata archaeon]|nr:MAG: hypothetical protein JSW25_08995 [Thermoplasmata archaeon]